MRCVSCGREDLRVVFLRKVGSTTLTYCDRCEDEHSESDRERRASAGR